MRHTKLLFLDSDRTKAGAKLVQNIGKATLCLKQKAKPSKISLRSGPDWHVQSLFKVQRKHYHPAACTVNGIGILYY